MRSRRIRRAWWLVSLGLLAVIVVLLAYGVGETYWIDVKEYTFTSPDVPASFDGTKIVLLTDIHRGPFFSEGRVRSLVKRVNTLKPDLIVLGGDYVYMGTDYASSCFEELRSLSAPLGRFAVLGNHDYGQYAKGEHGPDQVIEAMNDAGITLLRDDALWVKKGGDQIRLGGVSDSQIDRPRFNPTLEGTSRSDLVILVSHEPDYAEKLPSGAVDLVLSGHTHGGQVAAFGKWAFYVPSEYGQRYRTGMVKNDVTTVIVSNGIGTSTIPPVRLCVRPQIVVVTLERGASTSSDD
jgi:predicted MPP superfamily phosphohydrolase